MKIVARGFILLAAAMTLAMSFHGLASPFEDVSQINYRVTVTVIAGGQQYSGSSVWQLTARAPRLPTDQLNLLTEVRGEAIPIALDHDRIVYFLRRGARNPSLKSFGNFPIYCPSSGTGKDIYDVVLALREFKGPCKAGPAEYYAPLIVEVDRSNPTVSEVTTCWSTEVACAGISVSSIVVERTQDELMVGLVGSLPWLSKSDDPLDLIGTDATPPILKSSRPPYHRQDFSTEF